jgi:hypothetical protein
VLIFTQYADTAQYLYDHLAPDHPEPDIEVIYSQDKSKARVVGRFAPKANPHHAALETFVELDTLIATDVLSEGLNLQDCDNVINYDLHWNPVRLIQRFGRIDRIGSEHDVIYGYNFLPEKELEKNLGLHDKLHRRIEEIHATIGEDAAILEPEEQLNAEAMYAIYAQGEVGRYEDAGAADAYVDLNEALELIRQLQEDDPALYQRITELRDGVRCAVRTGREGSVVFCRAGRYQQLFLLDADGEIISRDIPHILYLLQCEPETPAHPLPAGYNARVMRVKRRFAREVRSRRAEQAHTLALTKAQQYVLAELHAYYTLVEPDVQRQIDALDRVFRQPLTRPSVRKALRELRQGRVTGAELVEALTELYRRYGLDQVRARRQDADEENDGLPHIVCSEGLVE